MELTEERIVKGISVVLLIAAALLWWFVFFETGKDWWQFDVGERIDPPGGLRLVDD
ncbi:MAG: hypothetical protein V3W31_07200 [Thermodesulfobacteriota bacterium]